MITQERSPGLLGHLKRGRAEARQLASGGADVATGVRRLAAADVLLAVAEVRDGIDATIRAVVLGAVTVVFSAFRALFVPVTLLLVLSGVMPWWAASLITLGALALLTGIALMFAIRQFKRITLLPKRALRAMKEDATWLKEQTRPS